MLAQLVGTQGGFMHGVAHIGKTIRIKGEITAQEPLTIAGQVIGTIDVTGHPLTVTESATIEADVLARTIIVSGTVDGTLQAEGLIVVEKTAMLSGDVSAPSVLLHDGATVHGRLDIAGRRKTQPLALAS
jgi:cytoskeletal protein CcmA (bactofilin family)